MSFVRWSIPQSPLPSFGTCITLQCQGQNRQRGDDESSIFVDCFIQYIRLYSNGNYSSLAVILFMVNNTADIGSAIYGSLLDRCTASTLAEAYNDQLVGLQYVKKIVEISEGSTIASDPVRVIFCNEYDPSTIYTKKGDTIKINVTAIDQVGNSVNATIHSSVVTESGVGRLKEGQAQQRVGNQCTELEYNVFSQDNSAQVEPMLMAHVPTWGYLDKLSTLRFSHAHVLLDSKHLLPQLCVTVCVTRIYHHTT